MFHNIHNDTHLSKSLAWLLRHGACKEGFEISPEGYLSVEKILNHHSFRAYQVADIARVVDNDAKKRYKLRYNPTYGHLEIKANQGHSIYSVSEGLKPITYPKYPTVVHGTSYRCWQMIQHDGLNRMTRNHIHFAKGTLDNPKVISGIRKDTEVLIYIDLKKALEDGLKFYESENDVILTSGNSRGFLKPQYFSKVVCVETDMKAAANSQIAVASSSKTNNTNNKTIRTARPNNSKSNAHHTQVRQPAWPVNLASPIPNNTNHIPIFPPNRMINSASSHNNMPAFPPNRPINSAPNPNIKRAQMSSTNDANNRTSKPNNVEAEGNNSQAHSPRRRRNNGEQNQPSPRNAQGQQPAHNKQNARKQQVQDAYSNRILVNGYPTFTQPHDLLEVFSKFGDVRIDKCNSWSATLTYNSDEQAKSAIAANKRLHIYGHFLSVRPYSAKLKAEEGPQSPKRDFTKSKQKSVIIEPTRLDLSGDFHSQLDIIMAAIRLNQEDISRISILYRDLENAFQSQWPGCKAIPFGSITTGLGIKTSDADCFINLPPQFRHPNANHVNKARRLLITCPQTFAEILAIPRANTPIVKFYHVPTDTNCDLTFKTPLGAQNSRLIAFLLQADPRITPMAVIIKYWAKVHDLSGTGKLTNYALTMMIIFYLQQPPMKLLPSVEWLQRDRANDVYVDFWNTGFMSNANFLPPTSNTATISEMLGGFFEYYSIFNFEEMVVCPFLGIPIKKEAFKETASLPAEFSLYKKNVLNNYVMPIRYQTSFCVQDPFEQCHNVASTITSKLALDIKTFFKFAANIYEKEKLNNCATFLKTILIEKPKLIRGKTHPEYRVNLFPRIINTIISFDWKSVVRQLVIVIFENMMKIKLGKVEEKVNPDTRKEKEKYMGSLTKPIWKRKKYNYMYSSMPEHLGIEEKQSLISEAILEKEVICVGLQFQLTLTFCHDPKSAVLSIRMGGGDLDAFREFGKFFISVMQSWFTQLLKPYSMPNCKDTAAKIAETVDGDTVVNDVDTDDDDEEIILTPSTVPVQKDVADEKTVENSSETSDEMPPEAATVAEDASANK